MTIPHSTGPASGNKAERKWWGKFLRFWGQLGGAVFHDTGIPYMYTGVALPAEFFPYDTFSGNWYKVGWVVTYHGLRDQRHAEARKLAEILNPTPAIRRFHSRHQARRSHDG